MAVKSGTEWVDGGTNILGVTGFALDEINDVGRGARDMCGYFNGDGGILAALYGSGG